jgi:cellulose biosynthesis protein BcsQ
VLSVISLKGGVGKTSVVLGLAGAALERGLAVLVVDLDPQASATTGLGVSPPAVDGATAPSAAEVLDDPRGSVVRSAVVGSGWAVPDGRPPPGRVDVLPGSAGTDALDDPRPPTAVLRRLRTALGRLDGAYDLVLLDCPPTLRRLTRTALVASDRVLVVTEPGLFALQGADRALQAVAAARADSADVQPLGVVVNRFRDRSPEHRYRLEELQAMFGPLVLTPPVPDRSAVQQAQGASAPVQTWGTPGSREVAAAYDRVLGRVLRSLRATRPGEPGGR